jgi:hypothetical protein
MDNHISSLVDSFQKAAFDYLCLAQSPAEADMVRFLTCYSLNLNTGLKPLYSPRLKNNAPWDFYTAIYDFDANQSPDIQNAIAEKFTTLKFENELSLNQSEKNLCPYHPMLNNLPPLILPNKVINFATLNCFKITQAQPFLDLDYRYFTTENNLKTQIHELNNTADRNARLHKIAYPKRIKNHAYFDNLNGQRGVFAKTDIPAGTIIDYYSGEYQEYPAPMPPILCTWRVNQSEHWFSHFWNHRKISRFSGWTDAFVLGNMMKLVNSCYTHNTLLSDIGNIGCYFFHFKSKQYYLSLPVYVATKDIAKDSELLAFYHVGTYKNSRVYGI